MHALTLSQPHATLMALGKKRWETRSWKAPAWLLDHPLAIHAGNKFDPECRGGNRIAQGLGPRYANDTGLLPFGGIVAVVLLVDCRETTDGDRRRRYGCSIELRPEHFGDFSEGRYVWETELLLKCVPHIVCRGYQGLWKVPANIAAVLESRFAVEAFSESG